MSTTLLIGCATLAEVFQRIFTEASLHSTSQEVFQIKRFVNFHYPIPSLFLCGSETWLVTFDPNFDLVILIYRCCLVLRPSIFFLNLCVSYVLILLTPFVIIILWIIPWLVFNLHRPHHFNRVLCKVVIPCQDDTLVGESCQRLLIIISPEQGIDLVEFVFWFLIVLMGLFDYLIDDDDICRVWVESFMFGSWLHDLFFLIEFIILLNVFLDLKLLVRVSLSLFTLTQTYS